MKEIKGLSCPGSLYLPQDPSLSPAQWPPWVRSHFPETFPATAAPSVLPGPAADHTCSASQHLPHICPSSSSNTSGDHFRDRVWRPVQSITPSWAHTLRRQQLSSSLFLALMMALRCSVQTQNSPFHCSHPRLLQGHKTFRL